MIFAECSFSYRAPYAECIVFADSAGCLGCVGAAYGKCTPIRIIDQPPLVLARTWEWANII